MRCNEEKSCVIVVALGFMVLLASGKKFGTPIQTTQVGPMSFQ